MHPILHSTIAALEQLPGGCKPPYPITLKGRNASIECNAESYLLLDQLLSEQDVLAMLQLFRDAPKVAQVGLLGISKEKGGYGQGSKRTSFWAPKLAEQLYQLLVPFLKVREMHDHSRTDWWQEGFHRKWQPIGLSPLLRFMTYSKGSQHYPHYDAAFMYPDSRYRSLMSVLFYLTTHQKTGATRLLKDGQDQLPEWERQHEDWHQRASKEIVYESVSPQAGRVFLFDHRILHDAEVFEGEGERILVRGDLVFEMI
jgi:hypothetical protein